MYSQLIADIHYGSLIFIENTLGLFLKVIKDITITKIIQKTLDETNHKPKNVGK